MKKAFIPVVVKREPDYEKVREVVNKIPEKKLGVCYSNQFVEVAKKVVDVIDKKVVCNVQVLGCSSPKFPGETEAILLIGEAEFHAVSLAYESKLPVYVLENDNIRKVDEKEVEKLEKREKGAYMKYLDSKKIGILVSTKPGQEKLNKALEFKKNLKDKEGYLFLSNDINSNEFENFPLDFWVNTACPRMDLEDVSVVNMGKVDGLE